MQPRERLALGALAAIVGVTAAWWALALWPLPDAAPAWLLRTRAVCFGASRDTLPSTAGWMLLIGEPLAMLGTLVVIWGDALARGLRAAARRPAARLVIGAAATLAVLGMGAATVRVAAAVAGSRALSAATETADVPSTYPRLDRTAPPLHLVDQRGDTLALSQFRGRPVLLTFAYAHCTTVCPIIVHEVLDAQRRLNDMAPAVIVVTLDPWRDTPARLPSLGESWGLGPEAHVLSGSVAEVERVLDGWNVARVRDAATGEVTHASVVYVIDRDGRIAYAVGGHADAVVALARRL